MSALAEDRRSLIERIRSVRFSLRSAKGLTPPETPVEEYDRLRWERRFDGKERIGECCLGWLVAQGLTLLLLLGNLASHEAPRQWEWWRWLGPMFFGLVSIAFGSAAAVIAVRDCSLLPRRWTAAGLAPWAVLVAESTLFLVPWL